jgi:hypothetical protein
MEPRSAGHACLFQDRIFPSSVRCVKNLRGRSNTWYFQQAFTGIEWLLFRLSRSPENIGACLWYLIGSEQAENTTDPHYIIDSEHNRWSGTVEPSLRILGLETFKRTHGRLQRTGSIPDDVTYHFHASIKEEPCLYFLPPTILCRGRMGYKR